PAPSPAAAANRHAGTASGEYLLFLGGDTEIVHPDWIETLLMYAEIPSVGIVGPQLVNPDGRVRQAGFAVRRRERNGGARMAWWHGRSPAEPLMRGAPGGGDGYYGSLSCAREVTATSASCMVVERSTFERLGGFSEEYRSEYHDVDLCLRARELGLDVAYVPEPRVISHASAAPRREDMVDRALFVDSWFERLDRGDPYLDDRLDPVMR
ncbi:MAG: glycosyltransferase family 2 protein, partial [Solirubrobacterales bacterium]